ncbi:hypothetical protein [Larkinella rosea]|uniref:Uncharacterized protein n=1 Tax=Larkinella rosea TaxID=2025312 RepID=A0A3P1BDJ0_9BACT|nr:hypothetical protein [Larkinella rosea]RRA99148.1 hypothetical protein EHT25_29705 [Larkinella rosea]
MKRPVLILLICCFSAVFGYSQSDTVRQKPQQLPTTISPIVTPSNSAPLTTPAVDPVTTPGKVINPRENRGKRKVRVMPPSDPNAFGVGVSLEKKDTTRRKDN